jgi:hypothetical protein
MAATVKKPPRKKAAAKKKTPNKAGRTPTLTAKVKTGILKGMGTGLKFPRACEAMGIKPATGREWLRRGEDRDSARQPAKIYATFATEIRKKEAGLQDELLGIIKKESAWDWKAARDLLKMLWPSEFGNMDRKTAQTKTEDGPKDPLVEALERRRLKRAANA